MSRTRIVLPGMLVVLTCFLSWGCAAVPKQGSDPLAVGPAEPPAEVHLEIHSEGRRSERKSVPFRPEMTVQGALDAAEVGFRYGSVTVVRNTPKGEVRMSVEYSGAQRQVVMSSDYALQPGDRIVLRRDNRTVVERMFAPVLNPLGRAVYH